jgi:hypothetical protein
MQTQIQTIVQNNVFSINESLQLQALAFIRKTIRQQGATPRKQMIELLLGFLSEHDLSRESAEKIACRALCEYESVQQKQYVDVNETTAYCIAVRDPRLNVTRYFSILDVVNMLAKAQLITMPTPSVISAKATPSLPLN